MIPRGSEIPNLVRTLASVGALLGVSLAIAIIATSGGADDMISESAKDLTKGGNESGSASDQFDESPGTKRSARQSDGVESDAGDDRQRFQDVSRRISNLKDNLDRSSDPSRLMSELYRDMRALDSFARRAIYGALESELADLAADPEIGLGWLAGVFQEIAPEMQKFEFDGRRSEEHFFSFLAIRMGHRNIDAIEEISKIGNSELRRSLLIGVVPRLMMINEYGYDEDLASVEPSIIAGIYDKMFEITSKEGVYRSGAIDAYLSGLGGDGLHENAVSGWFRDKAWFWRNWEDLSEIIGDSAPGDRRDTVMKELVSILSANDTESARALLPLFSNAALVEDLSRQLDGE